MKFNIEEIKSWVVSNGYQSVAVETPVADINLGTQLVFDLQQLTPLVKYYLIPLTCNCSVDYLAGQHLTDGTIQAIIYVGKVCLTHYQHGLYKLPVFLSFGFEDDRSKEEYLLEVLTNKLQKSQKTALLYSTNFYHLSNASSIKERFDNIDIATINSSGFPSNWTFDNSIKMSISDPLDHNQLHNWPFHLPVPLSEYATVVHIGRVESLQLKLACQTLIEVDPDSRTTTTFTRNGILARRVALIERARQCKTYGFIFSNPFPKLQDVMTRVAKYTKGKLKVKIYWIAFAQTLDDTKLGNYPSLESLVIVNGCGSCSGPLGKPDKISMALPILTMDEFLIAMGREKITYGGVTWDPILESPENEEQESESRDKALISADILSVRGSQSWYGLELSAGKDKPAQVEAGLSGRAANYESEPQGTQPA